MIFFISLSFFLFFLRNLWNNEKSTVTKKYFRYFTIFFLFFNFDPKSSNKPFWAIPMMSLKSHMTDITGQRNNKLTCDTVS